MDKQRYNLAEPEKVLIIKPSALGDVVTAIAVLRGLRRSFGDGITIDWLLNSSCAAAVAEDPQLDEAIIFDRKALGKFWRSRAAYKQLKNFCRELHDRNYDWVIDLQGLLRSGFFSLVTGAGVRAGFANAREMAHIAYTHKLPENNCPIHTVDRNIALAKMLGVDAHGDDFFTLKVPPSAQKWLEDFLAAQGDDFILACPATRWQTKLYPQENWLKTLEVLAKDKKVVLAAGPGEEHLTEKISGIKNTINLTGKTSIAELMALVSAAKCVISCDSAAMNMAAALKVPQVTLIGPTDPARTGPYRQDDAVVISDLDCVGCLKRKCTDHRCMALIEPEKVVAATMRAMRKAESR